MCLHVSRFMFVHCFGEKRLHVLGNISLWNVGVPNGLRHDLFLLTHPHYAHALLLVLSSTVSEIATDLSILMTINHLFVISLIASASLLEQISLLWMQKSYLIPSPQLQLCSCI